MSSLPTLIDDLVAANRILADLNVLDGFRHVSVRHPDDPARYLLSRSQVPEHVTANDIMTFDLASNAQDDDTRTPYQERSIHGEISTRRPDVQAVVHRGRTCGCDEPLGDHAAVESMAREVLPAGQQ